MEKFPKLSSNLYLGLFKQYFVRYFTSGRLEDICDDVDDGRRELFSGKLNIHYTLAGLPLMDVWT